MNTKPLYVLESRGPWTIAVIVAGKLAVGEHRFAGRAQAQGWADAAVLIEDTVEALAIRIDDLDVSGTPDSETMLAVAHLVVLARYGAHPHGPMIDVSGVAPFNLGSVRRIARELQVLRDRIKARRHG